MILKVGLVWRSLTWIGGLESSVLSYIKDPWVGLKSRSRVFVKKV